MGASAGKERECAVCDVEKGAHRRSVACRQRKSAWVEGVNRQPQQYPLQLDEDTDFPHPIEDEESGGGVPGWLSSGRSNARPPKTDALAERARLVGIQRRFMSQEDELLR